MKFTGILSLIVFIERLEGIGYKPCLPFSQIKADILKLPHYIYQYTMDIFFDNEETRIAFVRDGLIGYEILMRK